MPPLVELRRARESVPIFVRDNKAIACCAGTPEEVPHEDVAALSTAARDVGISVAADCAAMGEHGPEREECQRHRLRESGPTSQEKHGATREPSFTAGGRCQCGGGGHYRTTGGGDFLVVSFRPSLGSDKSWQASRMPSLVRVDAGGVERRATVSDAFAPAPTRRNGSCLSSWELVLSVFANARLRRSIELRRCQNGAPGAACKAPMARPPRCNCALLAARARRQVERALLNTGDGVSVPPRPSGCGFVRPHLFFHAGHSRGRMGGRAHGAEGSEGRAGRRLLPLWRPLARDSRGPCRGSLVRCLGVLRGTHGGTSGRGLASPDFGSGCSCCE